MNNKRVIKSEGRKVEVAQLKKASMALDDLVWTLQKLNVNQLSDAAELLRESLDKDAPASSVARTYQSSNQNKHFLIGVLPRLFQDRQLFPQNEDIADFAAVALKLEMSRTEKRSRYEIIGKVVCETDTLDDAELSTLVQALENLVGDKDKLAQMAEKKRAGSFSWNETLQELLRA
ncbi:hypothetical protein [Burkholderia multivorans]|uniref:hypothetical protein n=1 Tax=Burkholderia multivorans TaxID=87883 RepID=UPI0011301CBD|nr:hypothetical protein [Burkholderia multivorans]HEM7808957.1 hypothetical protein [Burkholderia multivorans]HEM7814611.1 hypothetical protein [Burkholderia multivorans]HEM7819316.1 hypothetical protein [Burkholderia multivorans]HEM7824240.1 hypothetical protein [Burkholderia multivorans]